VASAVGNAVTEGLGAVGGGDVGRCRGGPLLPRGFRGEDRGSGGGDFGVGGFRLGDAWSRVRVMTQFSLGLKLSMRSR